MSDFYSVRRLPPYVFEQVNRLKASARSAGADIIDLGMGNPDLPTPKAIVDKLNAQTRKALASPEIKDFFSAQGMEVQATSPEEFRARSGETVRGPEIALADILATGALFESTPV